MRGRVTGSRERELQREKRPFSGIFDKKMSLHLLRDLRAHIKTDSRHPFRFGSNPTRKGIGGNPQLQNQGDKISTANSAKDFEENFLGER